MADCQTTIRALGRWRLCIGFAPTDISPSLMVTNADKYAKAGLEGQSDSQQEISVQCYVCDALLPTYLS